MRTKIPVDYFWLEGMWGRVLCDKTLMPDISATEIYYDPKAAVDALISKMRSQFLTVEILYFCQVQIGYFTYPNMLVFLIFGRLLEMTH